MTSENSTAGVNNQPVLIALQFCGLRVSLISSASSRARRSGMPALGVKNPQLFCPDEEEKPQFVEAKTPVWLQKLVSSQPPCSTSPEAASFLLGGAASTAHTDVHFLTSSAVHLRSAPPQKPLQHRSEQPCVNAGLAFCLSPSLHARRAGHGQLPGAASSVEITFMQMWLKNNNKKGCVCFLREKLLCYLWKVISFELKGKCGAAEGLAGRAGGWGWGFSAWKLMIVCHRDEFGWLNAAAALCTAASETAPKSPDYLRASKAPVSAGQTVLPWAGNAS